MARPDITGEQWSELHRRCLNTLRAVLDGLSDAHLVAMDPALDDSVVNTLGHIVGVEAYWLREVEIAPRFERPGKGEQSVGVFRDTLDLIEEQYADALAETPDDPNILFGLSRVCQHALLHLAEAEILRQRQEPGWKGPGAYKFGSWESAVDYLADLLMGHEPQDYGATMESDQ